MNKKAVAIFKEAKIRRVWNGKFKKIKKQFFTFLFIFSLLLTEFAFMFVPSVYAASSPWTQTDWSAGDFNSSSSIKYSVSGEITLNPTVSSGWYDTSWGYRRKITFDNSAQTENLTNFPVMVKLDSTRISYANTQDSGQDIRFTDSDGTTLLKYEIEKWDETGTSTVWVKVPQIDASSSTDNIYMYYGNSSVADGQDATNVWTGLSAISRYNLKETTTTDANQFKASGYLDAGKISQAVSMYGNAAGTAGSTLTFNRGAQISGNNYEHINTNQGTISFWFKPSWNSNDGLKHRLVDIGQGIDAGTISLFKDAAGTTYLSIFDSSGGRHQVYGSGLTYTAGNWYHIVARWSSNNTVSGSHYIDLIANNVGVSAGYIGDTTWTATVHSTNPRIYIGNDYTGATNAQALIDDFAIYDRVLTSTEISSLYNSGTGNEAGYVADPSLKFYAKMDGSGTLSPVTYNGGASASKIIATSSELTGGTNLIVNGNMEAASGGNATGWGDLQNSTTHADAEVANILYDTRSQKISYPSGCGVSACEYGQNVTLTGGSTYHYSIWYKGVAGSNVYPRLYNTTSAVDEVALQAYYLTSTTWTKWETDFKVTGSGPQTIKVGFRKSYQTNTPDIYLDNVVLTPNLVDNGGMETYTGSQDDGITDTFTGWTNANVNDGINSKIDATATNHSGSNAIKITRGSSGGAPYVDQVINVTAGKSYLLTFYTRGDGTNSSRYQVYSGATTVIPITTTGITGTSYSRVSSIFTVPTGLTTVSLDMVGGSSAGSIVYFDDVSVIPLDNTALSFQSWTPVTDTTSAANNLSVHGDSDGVTSTTSGAQGNAYTFDGSTGYLRQKTYATNIGTLSYSGNTLTDTGQTFTSYKSGTSPATAPYMIVVTNSDNTTSWGYIGNAGEGATVVTVYNSKATSSAGWLGTSPTGKTPVGYEIRKSDYQITGSFTVGAWVKQSAGGLYYYVSKWTNHNANDGFALGHSGTYTYFWVNDGANKYVQSSVDVIDNNWHFVVGVYNGSTKTIYVDGVQTGQNSQTTVSDNPGPFRVSENDVSVVPRSVDSPFILNTALSADQVKALYLSEYNTYGTYDPETPYYPASGSLTSSIFDTGFSSTFGNLTYTATTPASTSVSLKARSSNSSDMSGATDWASCSAISSGSDISSNSCVTDSHRYLQYQTTLATTNPLSTPTLSEVSLDFSNAVAPTGSISINSGASYSASSTVTLTLSATDDVDASSSLQMQVSNSSDFSGASWESYATSKSWTLASSTTDGTKTVYVKFKDSVGNESSTYSDTIILDTTNPTSFDLDSPGDSSYTSSERPTFKWKAATSGDATSGLAKYKLEIDNGDSGDFTIDNIPVSRTTDYETNRYLIHYDNFSDSDNTNNYISVYTKHSIDWGQTTDNENDGKLKEGKRSWKVVAVDNAGNSTDSSRILYVDYTNPNLTSISVDQIGTKEGYLISTNNKPKVTGTISDNLMPDKVTLAFYKQNFFLGIETDRKLILSETNTLTNTSGVTSLSFSLTPSQDLDYGKYQVVVKGVDKAGNNSSEQTLNLQIMTDTQAKTLLTGLSEEEIKKIREESPISLPELEKKAILRREKEAAEFDKLIQQAQDQFAFARSAIINVGEGSLNLFAGVLTFVKDSSGFAFKITGQGLASVGTTLANTGNAVALSTQVVTSTIGNGILTITNGVGQGYNNIASQAPGVVGFTMKSTSQANQLASNTLNQSQNNLETQIKNSSQQSVDNLESSFRSLALFSNTAVSITGNQISATGKLLVQGAVSVSDSVGQAFVNLNTEVNKGQESTKQQIANTHKSTSNTIAQVWEKTKDGTGMAIRSIQKPAVNSKNFADRLVKSVTIAFTTFESYMFDNAPTKIANVELDEVGKDYVIVSWKTNHYTRNNKVNYGTNLTYGEEAWGEDGTQEHKVRITGLKPGEKYYFEVMSQNKNYAYDAYYSFETKK